MERKLPFIDSLRAFAVLSVIMVHCALFSPGMPPFITNIANDGAMGVQLFFIASALTLFLSLQSRGSGITTREFFLRRFFRIAPMFYIALVVYPLLDWLFRHKGIKTSILSVHHVSVGNVIGTLTFIGNEFNVHWINSLVPGGWSVTVEVMFYLFVPFLFRRITSLSRAVVLTVVTFVFSLLLDGLLSSVGVFGHSSTAQDFLYYWFPSQVSVFCLGIVLFHWLRPRLAMREAQGSPSIAALLVLASVVVMVVTAQIGPSLSVTKDFVFGIAFLMLAYGLAVYPFALLVNKVWGHIGTISYSMYLTHFVFVHAVEFVLNKASTHHLALHGVAKFIVMYVVVVGLTVGLSTLSYKYIENPFRELGSNWIRKRKSVAIKQSAVTP